MGFGARKAVRHRLRCRLEGYPITALGRRRPTIRVGIVDDHPIFRLGLKRALESQSDIDIPWEMASATNLDAAMRRSPVDVILMDIFLETGKDGITATREVTAKWPGVKVVVISATLDERNVAASSRAGADGFLPKAMPVADMIDSIRRLAEGKRTASNFAAVLPRGAKRRKDQVDLLSPRQLQVLAELRLGRTNKEIAARLGISIGTVNKHVHSVLTALNVRNRTQAAASRSHELTAG